MNQDILQYQKLDGALLRMQKELKNNEFRKQGIQLAAMRQEAEDTLLKLETRAQELKSMLSNSIAALDTITNTLAEHQKAIGDIEDIEELKYLRKKIATQYDSLDACERNIKVIIKDSEDAQSRFNDYATKLPIIVSKLAKCNEEFAKLMEEAKPKIKDLQRQQAELEGKLDASLLEKYKEMRSQNIYPVFVQLEGKSCGGCRMELTGSAVSQLDSNEYIRCEHCNRLLFK